MYFYNVHIFLKDVHGVPKSILWVGEQFKLLAKGPRRNI